MNLGDWLLSIGFLGWSRKITWKGDSLVEPWIPGRKMTCKYPEVKYPEVKGEENEMGRTDMGTEPNRKAPLMPQTKQGWGGSVQRGWRKTRPCRAQSSCGIWRLFSAPLLLTLALLYPCITLLTTCSLSFFNFLLKNISFRSTFIPLTKW